MPQAISAQQFGTQSMSTGSGSNIGKVVTGANGAQFDMTQVSRAPALNQQVGTGFFKGNVEVTSSFNDRQAAHQTAMANTRTALASRREARANISSVTPKPTGMG